MAVGLAALFAGAQARAAIQDEDTPDAPPPEEPQPEEPAEPAEAAAEPAEELATAPEPPEDAPESAPEPIAEDAEDGAAEEEGAPQGAEERAKGDAESVDWRDDPSVERHPGSYIGGAAGYAQIRAWVEKNEDHGDLEFGPMHSWFASLRVGDAFAEWFALGFQVELTNAYEGKEQVGAFNLLLDASFYPVAGLGIRPAVGLGLGFANGEEEWEFGGGGPGCLSLTVLYEFRITKLFVVAPTAQAFWITGQGFDGFFLFFGVEFIKWFETATG
jgi:hypothetical protein